MRSRYGALSLFSLALLGVGALTIWRPHEPGVDPSEAPELDVVYAAPVERIETHVLAAGETLGGVLSRAGFGSQEQAELLLALREQVNPRRLAAGVEVTVHRWLSGGQPRGIDVRVNADTTVDLRAGQLGWESSLQLTPVEIDTVYAAGKIDQGRTLYEAIVFDDDSNLPASERAQLVYDLADIYSYKIDFTREIQAGDSYRLVYEREARPDGTARSRRILAAEIVNQGKPYYALYFASDHGAGYYDRQSRSLRRGFNRYPVPYRITSSFARRRYHPILGIYRAHLGTDFGAPAGTPVHATADGTVVSAGWNAGGYGNLIILRHANGYSTRYAHLSRIAKGIRSGRKVSQNQVIGYVGSTGLATAAHLHYELRLNGRAINAGKAKLPEAPPIDKAFRPAFFAAASVRMGLLDRAAPPLRVATQALDDVRSAEGGGM